MCQAVNKCVLYTLHGSYSSNNSQGRYELSSLIEEETDSDLQFVSCHPAVQTKGYQILKVPALLAPSQGICM